MIYFDFILKYWYGAPVNVVIIGPKRPFWIV